jgi:CubicO group peptidase (beta-lactamase class C family)
VKYSLHLLLSLVICTFEATAQLSADSDWKSAQPEEVGLSADALALIHEDLLAGQYGYIDSFLVARHGKIVFEAYYEHDYTHIYKEEAATPGPLVVNDPSGPYNYFNAWWHPYYRHTTLHSMQSVTKSVVSAIIGIAIAEGVFPDLDTPVLSFFDADSVANIDERKRAMTLRHLLTMSDGLLWDENLPYTDPANSFAIMAKAHDWVQFTISLPMSREPGTAFNYNSGATLILGHIFRQATGIDIEEFAVEHLFDPLGIEHYYWDRTPFGLTDAQEGLYLSTRDLAKITQLFLQNGRWQSRQIIPEAWLVTRYPTGADGEGYGDAWWSQTYSFRGATQQAYFGKGFGGQRPILLPELELVIVLTGWNILPGQPFFYATEAINRVTGALLN